MKRLLQYALGLGLGLSVGSEAAPAPPTVERDYFKQLEEKRLIEKGAGSAADLAASVRAADDLLVSGEASRAAAALYGIVEGPRYVELVESEDYQNAEYLLGVALSKGGAVSTARFYLERVAARKGALYAAPALRHLIDLSLDAHDARGGIVRIEKAGIAPAEEPLKQEIDYLRGRAAYEAKQWDIADDELRRVGPNCRFYSSAIYLRGVIAIHKGDLNGAADAFCVVADVKPDDPLRFVVDGRYFTVRDLSRLALGRVAHEQGRYDDALYHYFTIPSDSDELAHALFESAWSMLQQKRWDLAERLVNELLKQYPNGPLTADGQLLRATLRVKTCRFNQAMRGFDEFLQRYEPVAEAVAEARRDGAARRALAKRLLTVASGDDSVDARLARLLSVDPAFFRMREFARGLRAEAEDAAGVEAAWRALEGRLNGAAPAPVTMARPPDDAVALLERVSVLGSTIAAVHDEAAAVRDSKDPRPAIHQHAREELAIASMLESRRARLAAKLKVAAENAEGAPTGNGGALAAMAAHDRAAASSLRVRAAALTERLDRAQGDLLGVALDDLDKRLAAMLRQARLGKIDALVGQKKRLEKEIEDLAAGRFPASMQNRLSIEGLIGDDEEYWPWDGERWADEYEGYK